MEYILYGELTITDICCLTPFMQKQDLKIRFSKVYIIVTGFTEKALLTDFF
jgi:hypothetical protein